jgi:hypothetical protein
LSLGLILFAVGGLLGVVGLYLGDRGGKHLYMTSEGFSRTGFYEISVGGVFRVVGFFIPGLGTLLLLSGLFGSI